MPTAVLTSKGQITLPIEIRETLGLRAGDRVEFTRNEETGRFEVRRKTRSILSLKGMVKSDKPAPTSADIDEAVAEGIVDRYNRSLER